MKKYSILQRYLSRGNPTWYGRIADGAIIKFISLGVTKKSEAMEWLNLRNSEKFLPETVLMQKSDRPFGKSLDTFLESVEALHGKDSATAAAYRSRLSSLVHWADLHGVFSLRDFSKEMAQKFAASVSTEYSTKTAREMLRLCRQFTKWCADIYDMEDWNPFRPVALPKLEKRKKDFWTLEQIDHILDAAPSSDFRLFWALMAFAGLRQSEACSFGPRSLGNDGKLRVIGKGNKESFLPVSERLGCEISRFGKRLYEGMFDRPAFRHSRSNWILRKAVASSGIICEGIANNHRFRHSFASNLIRSGVNVKAVQLLMRHENIQVTLDTYSHLLQDDLKAAVDMLSAVTAK